MKKIEDLEKKPMDAEEIKKIGLEIMQYIFSKAQENLNIPMPWGDENIGSTRKPTTISDTGFLMRSGIPPYWDGNKIKLHFTAPYSEDVEEGTPPHPMDPKKLIGWVRRKLGIKEPKASQVAARIAWKISRFGVDAHPFIRPSLLSAEKHFKLKIKRINF